MCKMKTSVRNTRSARSSQTSPKAGPKSIIKKKENPVFNSELDFLIDEKTIRSAFEDYEHYIRKYTLFAHKAHFDFDTGSARGRRQRDMMIRIILLATDCGMSLSIFLKAQFEQIMPWLKKSFPNLNYPPLAMLCSASAVRRVERWKETVAQSYEIKSERLHEEMSVPDVGYQVPLEMSARALLSRLVRCASIGNIEKTVVFREIELLLRMGKLANVYIASHPLLWNETEVPKYLVDIKNKTLKNMALRNQERLAEARVALEEKISEERLSEYV